MTVTTWIALVLLGLSLWWYLDEWLTRLSQASGKAKPYSHLDVLGNPTLKPFYPPLVRPYEVWLAKGGDKVQLDAHGPAEAASALAEQLHLIQENPFYVQVRALDGEFRDHIYDVEVTSRATVVYSGRIIR